MNTYTLLPRCPRCQGTGIKVDAHASWNNETQQWELQNTYEDTYCEDCEETFSSPEWIRTDIPCSVSSA